jgi:predicted  nucleic acid-binding Zn-ribbon protein
LKASIADQSALIELQRIDSTIQNLEHKLKNLPELAQLDAIAKRIEAGVELLKAAELEMGDVEVELKRSEIEVEQVSDRIKKDENRMNSGQGSAKELEQMQHELGTLAKRKSELEDGELEIMIRFDAVKAKVETLKNDDAGLRQLEGELAARHESASSEINTEIASETSKRKDQSTKIDASLIELYEKIRSATGGVGAALLVGNTCDGCHLAITPIELEKIKAMPSDDVVRCEECRRILVRI